MNHHLYSERGVARIYPEPGEHLTGVLDDPLAALISGLILMVDGREFGHSVAFVYRFCPDRLQASNFTWGRNTDQQAHPGTYLTLRNWKCIRTTGSYRYVVADTAKPNLTP